MLAQVSLNVVGLGSCVHAALLSSLVIVIKQAQHSYFTKKVDVSHLRVLALNFCFDSGWLNTRKLNHVYINLLELSPY